MSAASSQVVLKLRKHLSMSQAQFAGLLGIAKNSIYRYEAGTSLPAVDVLWKMSELALECHLLELSDEIAGLVRERVDQITGPIKPWIYGISNLWDAVQAQSDALGADDQLRVMALVEMIKDGGDEKIVKMIDFLLAPWVEKVAARLKEEVANGSGSQALYPAGRAAQIRRELDSLPYIENTEKPTTPSDVTSGVKEFRRRTKLLKELATLVKPENVEGALKAKTPAKKLSG